MCSLTICVMAHSGRTDSSGGHYDTSTGEYHYHHGYPEHQHPGGICPYTSTTTKTTDTAETSRWDKYYKGSAQESTSETSRWDKYKKESVEETQVVQKEEQDRLEKSQYASAYRTMGLIPQDEPNLVNGNDSDLEDRESKMYYSVFELTVFVTGIATGLFSGKLKKKATSLPKKYNSAIYSEKSIGYAGTCIFLILDFISMFVSLISYVTPVIRELSSGVSDVGAIWNAVPESEKGYFWKFFASCAFSSIFLFLTAAFASLSLKLLFEYIHNGKCRELKFIYWIPVLLFARLVLDLTYELLQVIALSHLSVVIPVEIDTNVGTSISFYGIRFLYFLLLNKKYTALPAPEPVDGSFEKSKDSSASDSKRRPRKDQKNEEKNISPDSASEQDKKPDGKESTTSKNEEPVSRNKKRSSDDIASTLIKDQNRYIYLKEELEKIPVDKVKKWRNEGSLTEEQYKVIVRKYNAIYREMKDTKERIDILKSLYSE